MGVYPHLRLKSPYKIIGLLSVLGEEQILVCNILLMVLLMVWM